MRFPIRLASILIAFLPHLSPAQVLCEQPPASPAGLGTSCWWEPDDSDWDIHCWDSFIIPDGGTVTEVRWRGGYEYGNLYGKVTGFVIGFWPSNSFGGEPDILAEPVEYSVRGLAGEHFVGTFNGIQMFEYSMTLNSGFVAEPGVKYWMKILGSKTNIPDWGLAWATGGDGSHFRWIRGAHMYFNYPHDLAFTLLGTSQCSGATVTQDPAPASTCATGSAEFITTADGSGTINYQWEREITPGSDVYIALADGSTNAWDGGAPGIGGIVSGSSTDTMTLAADTANEKRLAATHATRYRCIATNNCGQAESTGAQLSICEADFNCDEGVNTLDVLAFLNAWSARDSRGDFNHDGSVNTLDVLAFLNAWTAGC